MPGLLIKDFPTVLHDRLKSRAKRNHRSLTKEATAILETALVSEAHRPTLADIRRWRVTGTKPLTDEIIRHAKMTGRP